VAVVRTGKKGRREIDLRSAALPARRRRVLRQRVAAALVLAAYAAVAWAILDAVQRVRREEGEHARLSRLLHVQAAARVKDQRQRLSAGPRRPYGSTAERPAVDWYRAVETIQDCLPPGVAVIAVDLAPDHAAILGTAGNWEQVVELLASLSSRSELPEFAVTRCEEEKGLGGYAFTLTALDAFAPSLAGE
jgi:hypothetical protein